jgi:hypothetical protein
MTSPLPAPPDLRSNRGTSAIPEHALPTLAKNMLDAYAAEPFDPFFLGQKLETTYFDTANFDLRKARKAGDRYLTLRVRNYNSLAFALSGKTETEKFRQLIDQNTADLLLFNNPAPVSFWLGLLPANIGSRLLELTDNDVILEPVVAVCCRRYAVEDKNDRLTLDVHVTTDKGKCFPSSVLEFKSTGQANTLGLAWRFRRIKLSKFLWATEN